MYGGLLEALESGVTVVTANNRLVRTLQHTFDRTQVAAGLPAWANPDVVSWSVWLQRLWQESRLRGGKARNLSLLNDSAAQLLWQQSIAAVEQDRVGMPLGQFARAAQKSWKLVNEWEGLAAEEWASAGLTPDQQAFLRWSGEFRSRCATVAMLDAEQLVAHLREDVLAGLFDDHASLCFAGFDEWSPARLSLRDAFKSRRIEVLLAPVANTASEPMGRRCATPDDELQAAARWARSCLESKPDEVVGVVVPDLANRAAEVRRIFQDVFVPDWRVAGLPGQLPLNVSYGCPLSDTPIVQIALRLFHMLAGRSSFDDFSLLLRSPWLAGAAEEATGRALLEIELRKQVRIEFALRDALPLARKYAPLFSELLQACVERSHDQQQHTAVDWAHFFSEFLQLAGWPGRENLDSETWQTLKTWNELLARFAESSKLLGKLTRGEALACLSQLAQQRLFQPEGSTDGVHVLGALEAAGHEFDRLWITGLARELWPAGARPDPFIPLSLQRRLGMPDSSAARVLEHTRALTQRLLGSAADVVVSWPARLDGEELGPSLLVDKLEYVENTPATDYPLWNQVAFATGASELLDTDPPPAWAREGRVRGGVSVLNLQALSPLNAFIEKRLGAFEIRRPPVGIDAMRRGNLSHKALEDFYRSAPKQSALAAMDARARIEMLSASLQKAMQSLPGIQDAFMQKLAALELQQQLLRLEEFIEMDSQRPVFEVAATEQSAEIEVGPLQLKFTLDRIDVLADGSRLIIDYKTGRVNRQDWNPDRPRDLQLPVYVMTVVPDAAAITFAQVSAHGIGFDGVGNGAVELAGLRIPGARRGQVRFQYPHTDCVIESWDELRSTWQVLLTELAEQFAAGDFRFDPRNPDSARGQFAVLSRIYDSDAAMLAEVE